MKGIMDPVARAQAELDALVNVNAAVPTDGNPGDTPPAPAPAEGTTPTEPPAPADPPKSEDADYWRQRFEVMQGKYNAEVPRLIEQVNSMNTLIQGLQAQLGGKSDADPPARGSSTVEEALGQLQAEYGSELTDALDRLIQARLRTVEEKVSNVETVTVKSAYDKFLETMDSKVTAWRQLNTDPGFLAFIETPEPYSGIPYKALLGQAAQNCDSERASMIFNLYIKNNQPPANPSVPSGDQPPNPEALVAPSRRSTGEPPTNPSQKDKVWTIGDVNAFYKELELGKWRGREAEAAAIEAQILEANRTGRIVG